MVSKTSQSAKIPVGVGVRLVPAGVQVIRGVPVVRASLLLAPITASPIVGTCGKPVDLRHWPQEIEAMLVEADHATLSKGATSNVTVAFSPVVADGSVPKPALAGPVLSARRAMFHQQPNSVDFDAWRKQRAKDVAEIDTRWQKLVAPHDGDWSVIADGLSKALASDRLSKLVRPAAGGDSVPDIRGVGRGQAALLLSLERARSLLIRAQSSASKQAPPDRTHECNLAATSTPAKPNVDEAKSAEKLDAERKAKEEAAAASRTTAAMTLQQQIRTSLNAVTAATKASDRAKLYKDLMACLPQDGVAACLKKAQAADTNELSKAVDASVDRHQDSAGNFDKNNPPPLLKQAAFDKEQRRKGPQTRLRTLQSQPSLARLFNLVVDVLIPLDEFEELAKGATPLTERRGLDGHSRFGYLSAAIGCRDATRRLWTASKVRLQPDGFTPDVWACTRAEIDLFAGLSKNDRQVRDDLIAAGALSQMDGIVDLVVSQRTPGETQPEPRFDITSLDAFQAAETRATTRLGGKPGVVDLVTLRTVGFALIDRWRDNSALVQALNSLRRDDPKATEQVIDAEDLTTGYRMDVAVEHKGSLAWRSLCNRSILFAEDDPLYEQLLGRAIPDRSDRLMFDAGSVVMPAKIVMEGDRGTAHVEDIVGIWTGPSIGVDAESRTVALEKNLAALQLGHVYSLGPGPGVKTPPDWLLPRLLFGGGYHLGLTPRLLGGITRPLAGGRVYRQPGSSTAQHFGILPTRAAGPRRFLRHERIEAPLIATPEPILARKFDGIADGLRETSSEVVVRSKRGAKDSYGPLDDGKSGDVRASHRIVVPPSVSAVFVDRHGFFADITDKDDLVPYRGDGGHRWSGPRDGLRDVDYDQETGGFPVFGFSKSSDGGIEVAPKSDVRPSGDAVFRPRSGPAAVRRDPYYPDPAASFIVVAVRDLAGRQLRGKPLVVPTRTPDVAYPNVRPVALEVKALSKRSGEAACQERILGLQMADGRLLRGANILSGKRNQVAVTKIDGDDVVKAGGAGVPATKVEVALEPGESFEIDVWCLPTVDDLVRWFDAVETAALIASLGANGGACPDCETFRTRLDALDLGALLTRASRLSRSRGDIDTKICTSAKVEMPRGAVRCMAQIVFQTLLERPTPEIAARTTIKATHAIAQPHAAPSLAVALRRQQITTPTLAPTTTPTPTPLTIPAPAPAQQKQTPDRAVEIIGTVSVDRPSTGFFEIRAAGASLVSNAFDDDARRRRTPDEFARGLWPRSPVTGERSSVSDVYGFDVARDGKVTLTLEQATLLRVDDDVPEANKTNAGMVKRDLADLQCRAKEVPDAPKAGNKVAVDHPFQITDTRARILSLSAVAGSRTAWCFRDAKGDLLAAAAAVVGEPQTVVLPAAKAPAKVSPLTILPAFALHDPGPRHRKGITTFEAERKVRLRIRMRRPWFSSGEGERLGIVLWPPDILKNRIAPSGASVARDYDVPSGEKADISMQAFSDADLGPGGSFVTRWGLDPTKGSEDQISWLMPKSAFPDLDKVKVHSNEGSDHTVLGDEPLYVPRASVPIPVDDATRAQTRVRLEAALLTYVPRFDIDHEAWFCDVELVPGSAPEPFVRLGLVRYQPYAPPELQVSEPVVEWVQIPQRRTVCVTIEDKRPNVISVVVQGTGRTYGGAAVAGYDPSRVESWTQRPIMKVSVLRRRDDGVEDVAELADSMIDGGAAGFSRRAERAWAPRTQEEWTNALKVPQPAAEGQLQPQFAIRPDSPNESGEPLSWTAKFALTENALKPGAGVGTYSVFIEEVEPMLPTTYVEEPVDRSISAADKRVELAFSGPRFAARVDITPVQ